MGENMDNPNLERVQAQTEKIEGVNELREMLANVTNVAVDQLRFERVMEALENDRLSRKNDLSELNEIKEAFADYAVLLNKDRTQQQVEDIFRKYYPNIRLNGTEWQSEATIKRTFSKVYRDVQENLYRLEEGLDLEHSPHPKDEDPETPTTDV